MRKILLLVLSLLLTVTLLVACDNSKDKPAVTTPVGEANTQSDMTDVPNDTVQSPSENTSDLTAAETLEAPDEETSNEPVESTSSLPDSTESVKTPDSAPEEPTKEPTEEPTTEPEKEPLTDVHDVMAAIITNNDLGLLSNFRVNTDLDLEIAVSIFGFTTKMNVTGGMSFIQASKDAMTVEMEVPTQAPYSLSLVDGMLYVVNADGKYKCPMGDRDMDDLWSDLFGDSDASQDESNPTVDKDSLFTILSALLEEMDVMTAFESCEVSIHPTTGVTTVKLSGLSKEASDALDGALGSVTPDTTLPNTSGSPAESMNFLISLLKAVDLHEITITLTADKDMLLQDVSVSAPVDMEILSGMLGDLELVPGLSGNMPMKATLTLATTIERGGQTVEAPADADAYEETDFDTLFGFGNQGESGLLPDEQKETSEGEAALG